VTANEDKKFTPGARFGALTVLRAADHGRQVIVFCRCQRSFAAAIEDLLSGVARCPHCSPTETPPADRRP
jgi:hypothetical protein